MSPAERFPWFASASKSTRWLVGVSGGADSVALLHLLVEDGFSNIVACHLNHGLRGRAATEDAKFVERLAKNLGVKCEVARADVRGRMASQGESLETAARHARHEFFAACADKYRCRRVLLAHHIDDQAETVLWNLLRGSHGLKGMQPVTDFTTGSGEKLEFVRPLLDARHQELVDYLESSRLRWREDASNAEPAAIRNRLRSEALPLLAEISGRDAAAAFARAADGFRAQQELEAWALERANVLDPQGRMHVPVLRSLPVALRRAAFAAFLVKNQIEGIDRRLLNRLEAMLDDGGPPAVNLTGGTRMRRSAGRIYLERSANCRKQILE